jgi:hypothetical protein
MNLKKIQYIIPITAVGMMLFSACEKDYLTQKKVEISSTVSFSKDIVPILAEDCAKSSCHVTGAQSPDLTSSRAYDELNGLGYVDTTNASASLLYVRINATSNPMPPDQPLTPEEKGFILAWIKQGAQNN